eukprot:3576924-Alexandrium_andersonii.AAC.1
MRHPGVVAQQRSDASRLQAMILLWSAHRDNAACHGCENARGRLWHWCKLSWQGISEIVGYSGDVSELRQRIWAQRIVQGKFLSDSVECH